MKPARLADAVRDGVQGQADAGRLVERLSGEFVDPDELLRQILRARQWSSDRLRWCCKALQEHLERPHGDD